MRLSIDLLFCHNQDTPHGDKHKSLVFHRWFLNLMAFVRPKGINQNLHMHKSVTPQRYALSDS